MKQYDVYGIGNALVDTEYEVDEGFIKDASIEKGIMTLIEADERHNLIHSLEVHHEHKVISQAGGGSAANTIVAISQLGASSFYRCKVANDATGSFFLQDLEVAGVDTNMNNGKDAGVSGHCISMVTPDAERTMMTHLGISQDLSVKELDESALRNCRYLYIEGYLVTSSTAFAATLEAQKIVREAGGLVSVTLSDPAIVENFRDAFDQLAEGGIDLVFCNEDEAMIWTGSRTPTEAFKKLQTVCSQVAMTCGKEGAMVSDGSSEATVPGTPTKAVDTTGAGDMFAGAFLYAICQGESFASAAEFANRSASLLVSNFGARLDRDTICSLK